MKSPDCQFGTNVRYYWYRTSPHATPPHSPKLMSGTSVQRNQLHKDRVLQGTRSLRANFSGRVEQGVTLLETPPKPSIHAHRRAGAGSCLARIRPRRAHEPLNEEQQGRKARHLVADQLPASSVARKPADNADSVAASIPEPRKASEKPGCWPAEPVAAPTHRDERPGKGLKNRPGRPSERLYSKSRTRSRYPPDSTPTSLYRPHRPPHTPQSPQTLESWFSPCC